MEPKDRIRLIKIMEQMNKSPQTAEILGLKDKSHFKEVDNSITENQIHMLQKS